jgi:hypothetical protein
VRQSVAKIRFAVTGVALGLSALAVVPALADSQPFQGPGVVAGCQGPLLGTGNDTVDQATTVDAFGVGAACFTKPAGDFASINTAVTDDSGTAVPYEVQFQDAAGNNSATIVDVCPGQSGATALPSDISTAYVYLFADDPATADAACGAPSVATSGTMSVDWVPVTPAA